MDYILHKSKIYVCFLQSLVGGPSAVVKPYPKSRYTTLKNHLNKKMGKK
jgi:hypothetical protein